MDIIDTILQLHKADIWGDEIIACVLLFLKYFLSYTRLSAYSLLVGIPIIRVIVGKPVSYSVT